MNAAGNNGFPADDNGSAFQVVSVIQSVDPVDIRGQRWSRIAIAGKRFPVVDEINCSMFLLICISSYYLTI